MTEPENEFEAFLKTRTVLPNGMSDDDKLEPPKALDAIVLKKAREAIRAQQRLKRTPRWATPVALAATILLCLSIVLNVSLNTNRPTVDRQRMANVTAEKAPLTPARAASEGERREKAADGTSSREVILPETKVAEPRAPRPPVLAEDATPAPSNSPPAHRSAADKVEAFANGSRVWAQAPSDAADAATLNSAAEKAARLADRNRTAGQMPSGATDAAAPNSAAEKAARFADRSRTPGQAPSDALGAADTASGGVSSLAARGVAGTAVVRVPPLAASARMDPSHSATQSPAGGAATGQQPSTAAPAAPPPSVAESAAPSLPAPPATAAPAAPSPSGAASAAPSPSAGSAASTPADTGAETHEGDQPALAKRSAAAAPPHPKDPKTWLRQIATLRAEGKRAQADAEMQRFRATFPAYPAKPDPSEPSEPSK
jgi:hypothetical protein